jgi:hypothetical protein
LNFLAVDTNEETTTTKDPALTENECPDHFTAVVGKFKNEILLFEEIFYLFEEIKYFLSIFK